MNWSVEVGGGGDRHFTEPLKNEKTQHSKERQSVRGTEMKFTVQATTASNRDGDSVKNEEREGGIVENAKYTPIS